MTTTEFLSFAEDATSKSGPESSVVISAALAGLAACLLALVGTSVLACTILRRRRQGGPSIGDSARRCLEGAGHRVVEGVKRCFAPSDRAAAKGRARGGGGGGECDDDDEDDARRPPEDDGEAPVGGDGGRTDRFARWQSMAAVEGRQRSASSYAGQWTDEATTMTTEVAASIEELGSLSFSLFYSEAEQTLAISVLNITGLSLRGAERFEPYVKLLVLPMRYEAKTRVIRGTSDPEFDETFTLRCPNLEAAVIQFTVCSFDRYSRDVVLGDVACAVADVEAPIELETFLQSPIVSRFNQILLQQPGELLVSLSYQQLASRLVVTILKARNLPTIDSTSPLDTFVSICLLYKGQVIAVRATQVKAGEANPVYNETFLFDLPISEHLDKIAIVAKVCGCSSTMRCEPIGWLEISEQTPVTSQHYHWQQTITKPGRQVAQWHKLTHEYGRQCMHRSVSSR